MVSEAHCMSCPYTELLLFNYAKVKTVFHSMAPLNNFFKLYDLNGDDFTANNFHLFFN